jgi:hypothetical protein
MCGFDLIIGLLPGGIRRGYPEAKKKPTPPNLSGSAASAYSLTGHLARIASVPFS